MVHGKTITYFQFPATLAYAITDYKCQGQTFTWVIVDLKKPSRALLPSSSPYVQLSRAKTLARLSILRPFDPAELRSDLSKHLLAELEWQTQKAKENRGFIHMILKENFGDVNTLIYNKIQTNESCFMWRPNFCIIPRCVRRGTISVGHSYYSLSGEYNEP